MKSASQVAQWVKNPAANAGDAGSTPWSGRSPGGGHGNPLQYSYQEIPLDRDWWGYYPQGHKELDMTKETSRMHTDIKYTKISKTQYQKRMQNSSLII